MNGTADQSDFYLGDVLVQPQRHRISHGAHTQKLEPLVMEILVCLAQHEGETVSREYLMETFWPQTHVGESSLNRCVWKLRKALREDSKNPCYLETIPKRGYRIVATVRPVNTETNLTVEPRSPALRVLFGHGWLIGFGLLTVLGLGYLWWPEPSSRDRDALGQTVLQQALFVPLTSLRGYEASSVGTPSGDLAFIHYSYEKAQSKWQAWLAEPEGNLRQIFNGDGTVLQLSWTPDGEKLALLVHGADFEVLLAPRPQQGASKFDWQPLYRYPSQPLTALSLGPNAAFWITAERRAGEGPVRLVQHHRDGNRVSLTNPPHQFLGDGSSRLSPRGNMLAFVRHRTEDVGDLYLQDMTTGETRRLTYLHSKIAGLCWHPDGKKLVFSSDHDGLFGLWQVALDGSQPQRRPVMGRNATSPSYKAQHLVYEEWRSTIDLAMLDSEGVPQALPQSWLSSRWDWAPSLAPDGSALAFISNRLGFAELWLARFGESSPQRLTQFDINFSTRIQWHPDGTKLVFSAPRHGNFDIFVYDLKQRSLTPISRDATEERTPCFSADGESIYFASNRTGRYEIWKHDRNGVETQWSQQGGFAPQVDKDGQWLVFSKPNSAGIFACPTGDPKTETVLIENLPPGQWMNWQLTCGGLYFLSYEGMKAHVRHASWGQTPTTLFEVEGETLGVSGLSVDCNSSRFLLSKVTYSDSDLIISKVKE